MRASSSIKKVNQKQKPPSLLFSSFLRRVLKGLGEQSELGELVAHGNAFADVAVQLHYNEGIPAEKVRMHVDRCSSMLHLAITLGGTRTLFVTGEYVDQSSQGAETSTTAPKQKRTHVERVKGADAQAAAAAKSGSQGQAASPSAAPGGRGRAKPRLSFVQQPGDVSLVAQLFLTRRGVSGVQLGRPHHRGAVPVGCLPELL